MQGIISARVLRRFAVVARTGRTVMRYCMLYTVLSLLAEKRRAALNPTHYMAYLLSIRAVT